MGHRLGLATRTQISVCKLPDGDQWNRPRGRLRKTLSDAVNEDMNTSDLS